LQSKADELQAEITAIQDELKAELTAQDTDELHAGEYKIRFTTVTSNRFDSKSFKALYSELYKQFTKQTTSRRFSIG
jgi:predicted phage-related endonuclease